MKKRNRKPKEYLFVDGYNIINSWEKLKIKKDINLEEARDELIELLAEYHHYSGIKIVVVFDAQFVKNNLGNEVDYKGIKVIFTKERETADHYIEKVLDKVGRIKRVRVATSDWLEQQIILSRGGTRISARELEVEIENKMKIINKNIKYTNKINDSSLERLDEELLNKLENWKKI
ncbi:NYN domain-containing protein [Tissierella creatinophila]|uniref:YacP-like NYN domain protein n=1 Tax=Tissierella creatinophila DSM 6911 TaxID=1123403 RepID=A0A1U7M4D9_TISCR|nr:NYN domain-containing protein [Tissierella creatinophila]OLS02161.1 YacP-like NYN domain protein [Tissierella creatinophila DSM 6911]